MGGTMISCKRVDVDSLQLGAVLLVDTEDTCLKLIIDHDVGLVPGRCVHISNLDENEIEESRGIFMITSITVGEPINGTIYPKQRRDGVVEIGGVLKTTPVKTIEVYQDEELG
jgi:hypothetical protein